MVYLPIDDSRFGASLFDLPGFLYAYDASRLGLANAAPVPTFFERFGTRDMVSLSSPALATMNTAGINGRAAISYPRLSNQQHRGGNANPFGGSTGLTIYAVISHSQVTSAGSIVSFWNSSTPANRIFTFLVNTTGTLNAQVYNTTSFFERSFTSTFTVAPNTPTVVAMRYANTTLRLRANSTINTSSAFTGGGLLSGGSLTGVFSIGADSNTSNNSSFRYAGLLGSVYCYLSSHSDGEMDAAFNELAYRYGITL
jgi:hypothetical protein